jgi:hypothetical protein
VKLEITVFTALILLVSLGAGDNHDMGVNIETENDVEIGNQVDTSEDGSGFTDRARNFYSRHKYTIPGIERDSISRRELILKAKVDATKLSSEEIAAVSGVSPTSVRHTEITVGEIIAKARETKERTNWNKYANEAVASVGEYETSSGTVEVESPEDVSVNGNTFVVSSDGYVFSEGSNWAAPHCWDDKSFQPPEFQGEKPLVPQFDTSSTNKSPEGECPSWVSEENLEWLPSGKELARIETYCPNIVGEPTTTERANIPNVETTDELERIYYENGENAIVDVECTQNKLVEACGRGEPNNYCKKMNVKLCDYFNSNCGKAENVTVTDRNIWMEKCSEDTDTGTFEGKKTCITEQIGPQCAGENSGNCQQVMRSLCSYLELGYNSERNLCEVS